MSNHLIPALGLVVPALSAAVGVWLHARYGQVRLKIGDIEAVAQSVEEVEKLIARAQQFQEHNQPKAIHEPKIAA